MAGDNRQTTLEELEQRVTDLTSRVNVLQNQVDRDEYAFVKLGLHPAFPENGGWKANSSGYQHDIPGEVVAVWYTDADIINPDDYFKCTIQPGFVEGSRTVGVWSKVFGDNLPLHPSLPISINVYVVY